MTTKHLVEQLKICSQYGAEYFATSENLKVGISSNVMDGALPINGVRLSPEAGTTGWYIWAGETLSEDADFFKPLHAQHLESWCPQIIKFLGLPPGWRFLVADDYEDVWPDPSVLESKHHQY